MYKYSERIYVGKKSNTLNKLKDLLKNGKSEFYNRELDDICRVPLTEKIERN